MRDGHGRCVVGFILTNLNEVMGLYEFATTQNNSGVFFFVFFLVARLNTCVTQ